MKFWKSLPAILFSSFLITSTLEARLVVFGSFESDEELAQIESSSGVQFSRSSRFPARGSSSLEVSFPSGGGRLTFARVPADWGWQQELLLFVWSEQPAELTVTLHDDQDHDFSQRFSLHKGVNHLQVPLQAIGSVDPRRMKSITISSPGPGRFYFDYFALDRAHPVLAERGRWDARYSMEVETPHVKWAKPLPGSPIKAFILSPVQDGRGTIELAQRLDLDFRAASLGRSSGINTWGFGDFYEQRGPGGEFMDEAFNLAFDYIAHDLLTGPRYDVIVWPGLHPWEKFPEEVRNEILRRVQAGAGLVLIYPMSRESESAGQLWQFCPLKGLPGSIPEAREGMLKMDRSEWEAVGDHYITRGIDFSLFPWGRIGVVPAQPNGEVLVRTGQGNPVLAAGQLGKGRVVAFSFPHKGMLPAVDNLWETGLNYPYWEYMWPMLVRSVTWAAGREGGAAISGVRRDDGRLVMTVQEAPAGAKIKARLRDEFGSTEGEWEVPVGSNQAVVELPSQLQGGLHIAELRLVGNDAVYDSAASSFHTPRTVEIISVKSAQDRVKLGEPVTATVSLSSSRPVPCRISVRLFDNWNRLVAQTSSEETCDGSVSKEVRLDSKSVLTHLAKIDVQVLADGVQSDRKISEVFILKPRKWDDYDITMYRFGPDPMPGIWEAIDRQMRRLHVTTLAAYSLEHSRHANYNIQAQTRITGVESPDGPRRNYYNSMKKKYLETRDKRHLVREYCFHDPDYQNLWKQELARMVPPWVPFSPTSYYVYEEPSLTCYGDAVDICFSDHTLKAMREWLKTEYGSLDQLNRTWGTNFSTWEDVIPDDSAEAQERGNYASWADHRRFMELTYANSFRDVLQELRKYDPNGIILNSGTQISGSHNGSDYSLLNRYTEHLNAYSGGNQLDFHRNFNPNLKISGGAGYGVLGKDVLFNFYSNLFQGANAGAYIFWEYSTLDPDLTLCQSGLDMAEGFQEMRGEGIGKLVGLGTPDNHGIAIHYSYPSIHGAWIVDGKILEQVSYHTSKTFDRFGENRDGWVKILRDQGLQFDFISYGDVEGNGLIQKGYKVFILPMSVALSDEEVEAIRQFVQQGGTVVADALPGVMDKRNVFRSPRALADVFGIEAVQATREDIVDMSGEPHLQLAGARPLMTAEGRPILLEHQFGLGKAYLLNYFLDEYPTQRREGINQEALARMSKLLEAAGVRRKIRLVAEGGSSVDDVSMYLFNNGTTRLLGLVPDREKPAAETIRVSFDGPAAIYDVRKKRLLGTTDHFQVTVEPAVPELFAMVEKPINSLELRGPDRVGRGDEVSLEFTLMGVDNLRSVAKVVVRSPSGRQVHYYGGNRDIVDSRGTFSFRTALNDETGVWTVEVTDAISGATRTINVNVD